MPGAKIDYNVPPPPPTKTPPKPTNTLILANLPDALLKDPLASALRSHFAHYGAMRCWAPLTSMGRVFIIYDEESEAMAAKAEMDRFVWGEEGESEDGNACTTLRVFFGPPTDPARLAEPSFLAVPTTDKNFLISPPGSPPVGWEQIVEEPPNSTPLAQDLMQALRYLTVGHDEFQEEEKGESLASSDGPKEVVLIATEEGSSVPSLKVHSPPDDENDGIARRREKQSQISQVKATIESMGGSLDETSQNFSIFPPGDPLQDDDEISLPHPKILPTPRPPM